MNHTGPWGGSRRRGPRAAATSAPSIPARAGITPAAVTEAS